MILLDSFAVPNSLEISPGTPYPLGANWDGTGVNFAVFSAHAEAIEVCLFDSAAAPSETISFELPARTHQVFHGRIEGLAPGALYGLRARGPFDPRHGFRFNPNKLLFDPYAKCVGRDGVWDDALFGYPAEDLAPADAGALLRRDERDSAPFAPLAAVVDPRFDWGESRPPATPLADTVVYEVHVKGFSQTHPDVPELVRGTYAGLASHAAIAHFQRLGVTAVELLPIHYHLDEPHLTAKGLHNYWGYNTLGFFAPQPDYSADPTPLGAVVEFKQMVRTLHEAGIEVWLDVVYNHTTEGNERGPTLSFRGLDNTSYYRLRRDMPERYINYTGTGNTIDARHPRVVQLILDSLRYWVEEMRVDGFRFDLCSVLGRESDAFDRGAGFFDAVAQDPVLQRTKLIAEPWDIGLGGYQVGGYPTGWSEWNGKYRDEVRQFWKGDHSRITSIATRLAGSSDRFNHSGRTPQASVNFITAHDGFTLTDLVSYNRKHNMANGEFNRDGEDHNNSWNHGIEGPTDDPQIFALRERQKRNLLATLLLSAGVPMLSHGDEIGRTQQGNNNAYCQDNEISWSNWSARDPALEGFVKRLIALRMRFPQLRQEAFFTGRGEPFPDLAWFRASGLAMTSEDWGHPELRTLGALFGPANDKGGLLLLLNASDAQIGFRLPHPAAGVAWTRLLDTGLAADGVEEPWSAEVYPLLRHSFAALEMKPAL